MTDGRVRLFTLLVLLTLLAADLIFICLSFTVDRSAISYNNGQPYSLSPSVDWRLLLENEGSYAEMAQYGKAGLVALLLLVVFARTRAWLALVGAGGFTYIALDDALAIHEGVAAALKKSAGVVLPSILRWQAVNEVLVFACVGALFLLAGAFAYRRSGARERHAAHIFLALFALLVACGVGFDLAHAVFKTSDALLLLEDGGEMIAMSALLAATASMFMKTWKGVPQTAHRPMYARPGHGEQSTL